MKDSSFDNLKAAVEAGISQQQDNFTQNELLGRGLFASFLKEQGLTNYSFTEGKFDKVDGFITAAVKWVFEIKVRSDSAENYSTLFLEVQKLKALVETIQNKEAEEGLYINFIRNKLYCFNIRNICKAIQQKKIKVSPRLCNITTAVPSGKTDKRMLELPKQLAEEYEYIEGRWAKVRP